MKIAFIHAPAISNSLSYEQFLGSEFVSTPVGLLLVRLADENVWSGDYEIEAFFINSSDGQRISYINIKNKSLPDFPGVTINRDDAINFLSDMDGVERLISEGLRNCSVELGRKIEVIQKKRDGLDLERNQIVARRICHAICKAFPEVDGLFKEKLVCWPHSSGFAKIGGEDSYVTYVARVVDDKVHSIAKVRIDIVSWSLLSEEEMHRAFATSLAIGFVAKDFPELEYRLYRHSIEFEGRLSNTLGFLMPTHVDFIASMHLKVGVERTFVVRFLNGVPVECNERFFAQ